MIEEFSFDFNIDEKSIKKLRESLGLEKLEEIHNRFKNGTETEDDLINHYQSYKIKCILPDETEKETELNVIETKYYKKIIDLYQKEKEKNKELQELYTDTLKDWCKEKERAERHKQLYLMEKDFQENKINKYLIDKICERKFELQQEYKDFEDDIRLKTLEEIHKELLEGENAKNE